MTVELMQQWTHLEEPTSGEVLIGGKSLVSMSYNDKARLYGQADASKVRS